MIYGIGTDIVSYARIKALYEKYGVRAAERMLSDGEMAEYVRAGDPARYLMKRFAAKEAFAKAMGTGLRASVTLRRISVTHDELGKPELAFDEVLANYVSNMGIVRHHLTISDEREHAVAFVVLERA